jgi:hypothetical protein
MLIRKIDKRLWLSPVFWKICKSRPICIQVIMTFYHVKRFSEILFYLKLISMKFSKFRLNWMVKEYPNVTASLKHNQICFADVEMFDVNKKKDRF